MKTGRMKKINIKAQGHIEVILSFTIFIGFLLAIFYFLMPSINQKASYSSLNQAEEKLLDNLSIIYNRVSLIIKNDAASGKTCFSVANSVNFSGSVIVKDKEGNIAQSAVSPSTIYIESKDSDIYSIYASSSADGFNSYSLEDSGCSPLDKSNYSFSAPTSAKLVFFDKLRAMDENYAKSYSSIKTNLGIESDFEFVVYGLGNEILMNKSLSFHKIKISNVLSRNILLKSIDSNATFNDIILNLRVW